MSFQHIKLSIKKNGKSDDVHVSDGHGGHDAHGGCDDRDVCDVHGDDQPLDKARHMVYTRAVEVELDVEFVDLGTMEDIE